ncbi:MULTISPECIES: deoxyribodipyrimidine photo-lyase [Metallosphaera]|uniref:cryptochrome/photolyase family protein n=1 Tax=Metallosphaera TaxID=41980 RepID=UPI001F05F9EF|nr:deoxyribodipyrimidine photo-lyase [Metallosphaera sedula]MCH1771199.1 DNA photolyase family protein [Metallosphaera sedula]MCP6729571.1 DNA photolyase family protein [Metallosphaera sedula]
MPCAFVFRRDLRLDDNTCLLRALQECDEVVPVFVLDPRQLGDNPYKSAFALGFMVDSLLDLDMQLKHRSSRLHILQGYPEKVLPELKVEAIYFNEDYTPFSLRRDNAIREAMHGRVKSCEDLLLTPKDFFVRKGKPYTVFTHFYNDTRKLEVRKPMKNDMRNYLTLDLPGTEVLKLEVERGISGGRQEGLKRLERARNLDYSMRNFPGVEGTTRLSPYIKFGVVSPREVYWAVNEEIRRQLYWRDFYTLLAYYNPHVFGHSYKREYDCIPWKWNEAHLEAWKQGKTGYPIVDAGMRELNETGFMHNRTRMITASFLVKVLHVDWRIGERYFATKLVDYDSSVNNGNWQWVASTGADYMFRVFNPWLQQRKFDPDAVYIKTWVPELKDLPAEKIHEIYRFKVSGYPSPIVDYSEEVKKARKMYEDSVALCSKKGLF